MQNPSKTNMFMLGLNFALEILWNTGKPVKKTPTTPVKPKSSGASLWNIRRQWGSGGGQTPVVSRDRAATSQMMIRGDRTHDDGDNGLG
jgi:hypothetical protein